jgi:hypothetical protein
MCCYRKTTQVATKWAACSSSCPALESGLAGLNTGHTTQSADNVPTWARRGCARVNLSFSQVDAAWVSDAAAQLCNALLGWAPGWPAAQVDEPTRPAQGTAPVTCHATALVYTYSAYTVPPSLTTLRQPSAYTC